MEKISVVSAKDPSQLPWKAMGVNLVIESTGLFVDVEKAKAGPFGAPIAHGFLTLSLIPKLSQSAIKIENVRMGVNYGLNKVRFTSPVPVGSKLRGHMKLLNAVPIDGNGMQFTWEMSIEREGSEKPACIAESLARYYV